MAEFKTTKTVTSGIYTINNIFTHTDNKEADLERLAEEVSTLLTKIAKENKKSNNSNGMI